jgi:hypothetical protein
MVTVVSALTCSIGDGPTIAAYNAIPSGVVNCLLDSIGVEADNFNEFGDEVTLAAGTGRTLVALKVVVGSFGCENGHWFSGDCMTTPNLSFSLPMTANIYQGDNCGTDGCIPGALLATVNQAQIVPYRPSVDATNCPANSTIPGGWLNRVTGSCQNSIRLVLTFTFPSGVVLPDNVIWTVAYNTTNSGYLPVGSAGTSSCPLGGCGYDSLNVGDWSFVGAPYAGFDVNEGVVFLSWNVNGYPTSGGTLVPLQSTTNVIHSTAPFWIGFRPLGEIITRH